jgi:hypothetical protein
MTKPFDDGAARERYLEFLTFGAPGLPHFADRLAAGREPGYGDCYIPWLLIPALERERRGLPAKPIDRAILANLIEACRPLVHKNWTLPVPLWLLYRYARSPQWTPQDRADLKSVVLHTKFWMDEPGHDQDCYFTENHQILFHVDEYLAGQLYPDERFPHDGRTGRWHRAHAEARIERWMDWRARFGFSEWKSMGYSDALLFALLTLREFTSDDRLRRRADMVVDLILLQYALHNFRGDSACSQGRSSWQTVTRGEEWMSSAVCSLLWGVGRQTEVTSAAAICLACCGYGVPAALQAIALDVPAEREVWERESLDVEEGAAFGVDPHDFESILFYWGAQLFDHRDTIANSARLMPWDGYYMNERVKAFAEAYRLADREGRAIDPDPDYTALSRADQYAFRTPHYQVSCAQDYRAGKPGFGQHIWQATLGGRAVVFTTHPDSGDLQDRPNYWSANGSMPRAAAFHNVVVCVYRVDPARHRWLGTHAWFPKFAFDEVVEVGGWVVGRKGDGYVGLRSMLPARWHEPDPRVLREVYRFDEAARARAAASAYELFAPGHANVWVCELGSRPQSGDFAAFVARLSAAALEGDWQRVVYASPSLGPVEFGWTGPLQVGGRTVPLRTQWRIDSPYARTRFGDRRYDIRAGDRALRLDFEDGTREAGQP